MRHQRHKNNLGITQSHRSALLANLVASLVEHNRIMCTYHRAREASKLADKMVTLAKKGTLHARRLIIAEIRSEIAAKRLIEEFVPIFKDRQGGYTRVIKYRRRKGDDALLALLEFTAYPEIKEIKKKEKKGKKDTLPKETPPEKTEKLPEQKKTAKKGFFGSLKKTSEKK